MRRTRIVVESWSPEYGSPLGDNVMEPSEATVDAAVEVDPDRWRPVAPPAGVAAAQRVSFLDGVRRIEALVWIGDDPGGLRRGICASYSAGAVRAAASARVETALVRRGLFATAPPEPLETAVGTFQPMVSAGDDLVQLSLTLQQRLGELEVELALGLGESADLVVVDGPLSGRQGVPGAVGYVKTHRVAYLPPELMAVVARLAPGERTPLFVASTAWTRYSWYLRLPGPLTHPLACVVRLEAAGDLSVAGAAALADVTARTLPRYASLPHKDPRAPHNLFPIAGLERELRHRLGDPALVHRALCVAAGG
jgi:hypothetical protein